MSGNDVVIPLSIDGTLKGGVITRNNYWYPADVLREALANKPVTIQSQTNAPYVDPQSVVIGEFVGIEDDQPAFAVNANARDRLPDCDLEFAIRSIGTKLPDGTFLATDIISFDLVPAGTTAAITCLIETPTSGVAIKHLPTGRT